MGYSPGKMTLFPSQAQGKLLTLWNLILERVWKDESYNLHSANIKWFTSLKFFLFFKIKVGRLIHCNPSYLLPTPPLVKIRVENCSMPPTLLHPLYVQGPRGTWISSKSPLMSKVKGNLYFQYPRGDRSNNTRKVKRNSGGSMDCGWVWSSVIGKLTANNEATGMGRTRVWSYLM